MADRVATIYDYARLKKVLCDRASSCDCCDCCPLGIDNNGEKVICSMLITNHTDKANELIIKWCEENPQKTYKDDFLEKFPNAQLHKKSNYPLACRLEIYDTDCLVSKTYGRRTCEDCWNEVYEDGV